MTHPLCNLTSKHVLLFCTIGILFVSYMSILCALKEEDEYAFDGRMSSLLENGMFPLQFNHSWVHFRTYADNKFKKSKVRIVKEAKSTGWFKSVQALGPDDLPKSFRQEFWDILAEPRGAGYWIWKYPLFHMALEDMEEGDFLVYLDAGCQINRNGEKRFMEYIKMIQSSPYNILSFRLPYIEKEWTTESIFQTLGVEKNNTSIRDSGQIVGGTLILQKGPHLRKWLDLVDQIMQQDIWLFSDIYNDETKAISPFFIDNRHDQSVSSVTQKLVGSIVLDDETDFPPQQEDKPFWETRIKK